MRTTIEMAREAAGDDWGLFQEYMPEIHRFAELVRADERKKVRAAMKKAHVRLLKNAIAAERNSWPAEMEAMERQVNILTDALAQASKDAERYQVLRTWDLGGSDHGLYSPEEVDKAVDDCIKDNT